MRLVVEHLAQFGPDAFDFVTHQLPERVGRGVHSFLPEQRVPNPTPQMPPAARQKMRLGLNLGWAALLFVCFGMGLYGLSGMAVASKRDYGAGVNSGLKTVGWALAGAAGATVLRAIFLFFGV